MSTPILARLSRSARLAGQALRALGDGPPLAATTVQDFQRGSWAAHRRMSPQEVRWVLENAASGSLSAQWELFALMEDTWPRLAKNLAELRRAAARASYAVKPFAVREAAPTASAQERADTVSAALRQWWPTPGTMELSFEDTLFHALDAYGKGIAVLELHWQQTPDGLLPRAAHLLAPQRYGWNAAGTALGLTGVDGLVWQPFPADRFLVGLWQARSGAPGATAVLRALAPYWAGITFGWEWLLANAQIFGVPLRWATYDRSRPDLGAQLRDMLRDMGSSGYAAFPDGTTLELKEVSQNVTGNPQVVIQELANQACDLLILGQELSGGAQAAGLGGGAAGLQQSVRADRLETVAQWCADLLSYQLVPAVLRANYGDTAEAPVITPDLESDPDPLPLAQRDEILLRAGIELPRAWFYERHGIPEPQPGEPVLTGRAPTPAVAPGAEPAPGQVPEKKETGEEPAVAAKAAALGRETRFLAAAQELLAPAEQAALRPLLVRLVALDALTEPEAYQAAYARLLQDLPAIEAQVLGVGAAPALESAFDRVLGTALASGAAEARQGVQNAPGVSS